MRTYILYAENDEDDFVLLKNAFHEVNAEIDLVRVETGYDVIKFLQDNEKNPPALIVLDLKMPVLDGEETLELLKTDDHYKSIPVVLITGSSWKEIAFKKSGGSDVIKKPSRYDEWIVIARKLSKFYPMIIFAMACK